MSKKSSILSVFFSLFLFSCFSLDHPILFSSCWCLFLLSVHLISQFLLSLSILPPFMLNFPPFICTSFSLNISLILSVAHSFSLSFNLFLFLYLSFSIFLSFLFFSHCLSRDSLFLWPFHSSLQMDVPYLCFFYSAHLYVCAHMFADQGEDNHCLSLSHTFIYFCFLTLSLSLLVRIILSFLNTSLRFLSLCLSLALYVFFFHFQSSMSAQTFIYSSNVQKIDISVTFPIILWIIFFQNSVF